MANWRKAAGRWVCLGLSLAAAVLPAAVAQNRIGPQPQRTRPLKDRVLPGRFPDQPSLAPALSIPVEPLAFAAPGPIYLGARNTMASLDFLDESHLLFTFHVPGLLHRDSQGGDERQIRAVVLALPSGSVQANALWTVHDAARYLWMLKDGHFLIRDSDNLLESDASLELKPLLHFPGPLLWLGLDPAQQFLVADSFEPVRTVPKPGDSNVDSSGAASASASADGEDAAAPPDYVMRIVHRSSGQVMLVSRIHETIHLAINSDGYLDSLRGDGGNWALNLNFFTGGSRIFGNVESACLPNNAFISEREVLVTACSADGGDRLVAMAADGRSLWADRLPDTEVWPQLTVSAGGLRLARESLVTTVPVSPYQPLSTDQIKGQLVTVLDAATGEMVLEAPASPILDVGGNVAISPSGRRVAVVNNGAIQVFELPAPPPLPASSPESTVR
jgi:hypothetical protein